MSPQSAEKPPVVRLPEGRRVEQLCRAVNTALAGGGRMGEAVVALLRYFEEPEVKAGMSSAQNAEFDALLCYFLTTDMPAMTGPAGEEMEWLRRLVVDCTALWTIVEFGPNSPTLRFATRWRAESAGAEPSRRRNGQAGGFNEYTVLARHGERVVDSTLPQTDKQQLLESIGRILNRYGHDAESAVKDLDRCSPLTARGLADWVALHVSGKTPAVGVNAEDSIRAAMHFWAAHSPLADSLFHQYRWIETYDFTSASTPQENAQLDAIGGELLRGMRREQMLFTAAASVDISGSEKLRSFAAGAPSRLIWETPVQADGSTATITPAAAPWALLAQTSNRVAPMSFQILASSGTGKSTTYKNMVKIGDMTAPGSPIHVKAARDSVAFAATVHPGSTPLDHSAPIDLIASPLRRATPQTFLPIKSCDYAGQDQEATRDTKGVRQETDRADTLVLGAAPEFFTDEVDANALVAKDVWFSEQVRRWAVGRGGVGTSAVVFLLTKADQLCGSELLGRKSGLLLPDDCRRDLIQCPARSTLPRGHGVAGARERLKVALTQHQPNLCGPRTQRVAFRVVERFPLTWDAILTCTTRYTVAMTCALDAAEGAARPLFGVGEMIGWVADACYRRHLPRLIAELAQEADRIATGLKDLTVRRRRIGRITDRWAKRHDSHQRAEDGSGPMMFKAYRTKRRDELLKRSVDELTQIVADTEQALGLTPPPGNAGGPPFSDRRIAIESLIDRLARRESELRNWITELQQVARSL